MNQSKENMIENYFGTYIRCLRHEKYMSQDKLADLLGSKSFTTIQKRETRKSEPVLSMISKLSKLFNVAMDVLVNANLSLDEPQDEIKQSRWLDIIGRVATGKCISNQNTIEYMDLDFVSNVYFYLEVSGDSITPTIPDGAIL